MIRQCSPQAGLRGLRSHRASGGTESAHRTRHRWSGAVNPCVGLEVRRSLPAPSSVGDLCTRRSGVGSLDTGGLGRGTSRLLAPLVEALRRHVMAGNKIHGDDTPVPVLAPGRGKTKDGAVVDVCAR